MSRSTPGWFFIDYRKHPMLLVYEIIIGHCGSVDIKVVARVLHTNYEQTLGGLGESGRKYLANLVVSRRRNTVKRLGNGRDDRGNIFDKIAKLNVSPRSLDNVGAASPAALSAGLSVPLALEQSIQEDLNRSSLSLAGLNPPAILPNQSDSTTSTETLKLATDANELQTSAWLRLNGFQAFANNFLGFSATDMFRLSRQDLIEMCGKFHGIRLFNALRKPAMLTLYFAIEGAATPLWQVALLHNLTSGAFTSELLATMNLSNDRLHSVLFQGPHGTHIPLCDKFVANIKDESMYLVEIIRDPSNERFKLLLKRFPC